MGNAMNILLDEMILTVDAPTTGGSKMLEGYMSPFEAEVVSRLRDAGMNIVGKTNTGEMGFDLLGETSYFGANVNDAGELVLEADALVASGKADAAVGLDVNGTQRRSAAVGGTVCVKPTYGTVSRYGTIAIACSGEAVCVNAHTAAAAQSVLDAIAGHDDKDGTSLPAGTCERVTAAGFAAAGGAPVARVGVCRALVEAADADVQQRIAGALEELRAAGVQVEDADDALLLAAGPAWNILMSAELCNNVSRFDGVKYGYRTKDYTTIGQLYTNSRTEAFGSVLKTALLFGSETLSEENYDAQYDKALRIRRVVAARLTELFTQYDALIMPAASRTAFTKADTEAQPFLNYSENCYTAPASLTGMPAVVAGGVQLVGPMYSDVALLNVARVLTKEA